MSDFLLELRSEEIPARMQAGARAELEKLFRREMDAAGVTVDEITVWSTPRRLALIVRGLPDATQAVSEEAKGPPEGAPDAAVEGFCRKNGVTRNQLEVRDVKGRPTWFAVIDTPGRATRDLLAQAIPAIVRDFAWPKSMRWGDASISTESLRWVRPLSGIVALLGDAIVNCEVQSVTSGAVTLGHRFHHSGDITIGNAADYAIKLRAGHVIVDHAERQDLIRSGAAYVTREAGLALVEDEGLVVENAGLTEWPMPLLGRFDAEFLEVPPEVIQLTARVNQKYFVCEDAAGKLANAFICTANIAAADGGAAIVDGNRKVLAARLSDARFFWEQDRRKTLAQHAEGLARITFHEKLGTVADKVERVAKLARWLVEEGVVTPAQAGAQAQAGELDSRLRGNDEDVAKLADWAEQAARLAKADLVTEMVGEFPELQGLMGGYYARAEGLPDEVADAIRDHYKPVGQNDEVPTAPVTVAVSLADKLDTLVGFFGVRQPPTGSSDPFALRRAALGVIQLLSLNEIRLSLLPLHTNALRDHVTRWVFAQMKEQADADVEALGRAGTSAHLVTDPAYRAKFLARSDVSMFIDGFGKSDAPFLTFFADRLKVQQREAGVRHDLIDAVFSLGGEDDLVRLLARVKALQTYVETAEGANLLAAYKRAANILKKEDWQSQTPPLQGRGRSAAGAEGVGDVTAFASPDSPHSNPSPEGEGLALDGIARTGEEDPLALVDDPEMKAVIAAKLAERGRNSLSYSPEPAEKALADALDAAEPRATQAIAAEDFAGAMSALAALRAPIDRFFEEVTVNADDEDMRRHRLGLLARFRAAVHKVADFGRIEG